MAVADKVAALEAALAEVAAGVLALRALRAKPKHEHEPEGRSPWKDAGALIGMATRSKHVPNMQLRGDPDVPDIPWREVPFGMSSYSRDRRDRRRDGPP